MGPMNWLLLIHNIPPKPGYLRAKAARRLAALGAVALKNAVYVLPEGGSRFEDLTWLAKEIEDGGGKAFVCRAAFAAGLDDAQVRARFVSVSDEAYARLTQEMLAYRESLASEGPGEEELEQALVRFAKEFASLRSLDFFGAPGRETVEGLLAALRARLAELRAGGAKTGGEEARGPQTLTGLVWVTRRGVHVDRIASAWLIRRFIDQRARFRFVDEREHVPAPGEVRFDMLAGEFTHENDLCTFEVLERRLDANDPALGRLDEIIHDIDLKEERFGHPETAGLRTALESLALVVPEDERRIEQGGAILDLFYESFRLRG